MLIIVDPLMLTFFNYFYELFLKVAEFHHSIRFILLRHIFRKCSGIFMEKSQRS
ncbi:protein of unknown function [Chryseobacterium sp. JV274]|nr:protein of unknown function [Chryseobacterium sp. JV274]